MHQICRPPRVAGGVSLRDLHYGFFLLPPHLKPSDLSKRCSVLESQTPINSLHQIENKWQVQKIEDFPLPSGRREFVAF